MGLDLHLVKKISDEHVVRTGHGFTYTSYVRKCFRRFVDPEFEDERYVEDDDTLSWMLSLRLHGGIEECYVDDLVSYMRPVDLVAARKALDEADFKRDGKRRSYILMDLFEKHPDYFLGFSN